MLGGTGARTIYARFFDTAGNGSPVTSAAITVDTTFPTQLAPALVPAAVTDSTAIQLIPPEAIPDRPSSCERDEEQRHGTQTRSS